MTAQVLAPAEVSTAPNAECRVWERYPCELQVACQPVAAYADRDVMWPGTFRDLSPGGLGLVLCRRFERGVQLTIEIPETAERPAEVLLARVARVKRLPEGKWLLGCSFASELSTDEVQALLAQARAAQARPAVAPDAPLADDGKGTPAAGKVRKRAHALYIVPKVHFRWAENGPAAPVVMRQLFLTGPWPLPAGTVLRIRSKSSGVGTQGRVKVERCEQSEGRWMLTYRLLGQQPADVLELLGLTNPPSA